MKLTAESTVINDSKLNNNIDNAQTTADNAQTVANDAKEVAVVAQGAAETALDKANGSVVTDTLHYLATSQGSGVTTSTAGWTTTVQAMTATNKYLWTYHTYTKANGSTVNTTPVITGTYGEKGDTGAKGDQGNKGDTGVGVSSVQPQYYLSTSASSLSGGSWSTALTYVSGKYIWTRDKVTYSDSTSNYSTAIYNGALTSACANAQSALQIANDTAQYFWFTSSGSDTGAHISEKTQAQFVANPSGGNLLARSNGIAVRDGLQELANFSESGIVVGDFFDVTNSGGEISHADYTSKSGRWVDAVTINLSTDEALSSAWQSVASGETFIIRVRYVYSGARTVTKTERVSFVKGTSSTETYATYDGANSITVTASYPPNANPYQYKESIALGVVTISTTPLYRFGHDVADEGGGFCFLTGHGTKASASNYQFVCGKFNEDVSGYLVVGKGTSDTNRSNAFVVGTGGELYCKGHSTFIGSTTRTSLSSALSVPSNTDKNVLSLTIPAGSWVIEGQVRFASGAIGLRRIALSPNSADTSDATIDTYAGAQTNAVSGQQTIMNISLVVAISEDTRFYLCARQSASSAVNAKGALIKAIRIA